MIRIFLIGPDQPSREYESFLQSRGTHVVRFKSIADLMYRPDDQPDLIILERNQRSEPSFKEFLAKYREVPKIVFSCERQFKGISFWSKLPRTYPVNDPSTGMLEFLLRKALREKELILENEQLTNRLDTLTREVAFFDEISRTLTSSLELNDILTTIMKKAKKLIRAESWSIMLRDELTGELVFERMTGRTKEKDKARKIRLKMGEGIAGWVAQEGIPVIVPDVSLDSRFRANLGKESVTKTKSLMCVPIKSKGSVLGVLEIADKMTGEPFTKEDLNLVIRLVEHAAIAIERASLYQKMAELSITDDLTKLFNTRYLNRSLETEISRSVRNQSSLSLIFMDIDYFKTINDNYGHLTGSKILVEMGQILIKGLRAVDIVARYGGDEFVIVLPQTPPKSAVQIAERIRKSIERNIFLKKEGYSLKLTASFGVASYPESAKSKEELLRLADEAMYRVKYHSRNGVYAIV